LPSARRRPGQRGPLPTYDKGRIDLAKRAGQERGWQMAPGRAQDEQKERQWQRRIEQRRASGLSVRAFCARHGLATASFYNWRRVFQRRAVAEQPAFLPVQVVADAVPAQASALEVVLTDGRTVRVAPGFDAATLRRLLDVLEGRPC
jgi:hypothetical protein